MKFHLGSPVNVCSSPGCGKTFSTAGNLNRHIKGHHPELDTRKSKVMAASMNPLPGLDASYDSPTCADELLQADVEQLSMMAQLRAPLSPTSSVSTVDAAPSSPAPSSSCASPMPSMTPLDIAMDPEQLDELVSILNETVTMVEPEPCVAASESFLDEQQATPAQPSVLDDMIRFHIDHLQM
ncbi:unnamed protein product [Phytophthora fragariaefolia]|uniref:Unnamed protein product n=1 Tax=Phytophthora fragariaefolia TaxID=1490495 RepID=A0A9W6XIJ0_9STRA|nr:unnamed protein product [Phytophthora fragariaefolia]